MSALTRRLIDVAANLSDSSFRPDLPQVLQRAKSAGVLKFLLAGNSLRESQKAYEACLQDPDCYCTLGVHPCRANVRPIQEVNRDSYFEEMTALVGRFGRKLVAIGECGLDYDRLNYSSKEQQLAAFPPHFALAESTHLPMYLHSRNSEGDFNRLIRTHRDQFTTGLVHSYTGSVEELRELLDMGLYIGVNGCSLKTTENVEAVRNIPLDRLMIETDCPYCEIRKSHAGFRYVKTHFATCKKEKRNPNLPVRGRNEPLLIVQVMEAVAGIKEVSEEEVAAVTTENAMKVFGFQA